MKDYSELVRRLSDADDAIRGCGCCTNGLDAAAAILALTARVKELAALFKRIEGEAKAGHAYAMEGQQPHLPSAEAIKFSSIMQIAGERLPLSGRGV
jgi:hypothetical protein